MHKYIFTYIYSKRILNSLTYLIYVALTMQIFTQYQCSILNNIQIILYIIFFIYLLFIIISHSFCLTAHGGVGIQLH